MESSHVSSIGCYKYARRLGGRVASFYFHVLKFEDFLSPPAPTRLNCGPLLCLHFLALPFLLSVWIFIQRSEKAVSMSRQGLLEVEIETKSNTPR